MKKYLKIHPFARTGLFIFPILIMVLFMEFYLPSDAPEGYKSFIVAFEFARTPAEIQTLFADLEPEEIKNIDIANYIDFGFMLAYSLFLGLLFKKSVSVFKKRWLIWGAIFSVFIFLADLAENIFLLHITRIYSSGSDIEIFTATLKNLHLATWLKWGGLSVFFILFFFGIKKNSGLAKFTSGALLLPFPLAIWALSHNPVAETWFVFSVFGAFAALFVFAFWKTGGAISKSRISK